MNANKNRPVRPAQEENRSQAADLEKLTADEAAADPETVPPRAPGDEAGPEAALDRSDREKLFARRALLQAGWVVPVALAVGLPRTAQAQFDSSVDLFGPNSIHDSSNQSLNDGLQSGGQNDIHNDTHNDFTAQDGQHSDYHGDFHVDSLY